MSTETPEGLSIGQVAQRTGLSVHTLRFYEREGLLVTPIHRNSAGRRVYTDQDVEWLHLCTNLRASGMPLPAIRQYADLVRQGTGTEQHLLTLLHQHRAEVTAQIAHLTHSLDLVTHKITAYTTHLSQNPTTPTATPCTGSSHSPRRAPSACDP
ncbi:MerR family transcriptional regulator [Spongiactinospora sp. 9N601]|uniref:MerR family transcriptional regulator n=1 Tax=Spongiactinospora sp. 9N601 TaxID=3375149 RepID=UPI0037A7DCD7